MNDKTRRFWIETALAALSGFLCLLTLLQRDWIEVVFRVDPDQHNGALEWLIVASLIVAAGVFGLIARAEWQRTASSR